MKEKKQILSFLAIIFLSCYLLALFLASSFTTILEIEKISLSSFSLTSFLVNFFLGTIFFIFILLVGKKKKKTKDIFLKLTFIVSTFFSASLALGTVFGDPAFLIIILLIFIWLKKKNILVHNFLIFLSLSSVIAIIALKINYFLAIVLLIILSFYDLVAVYITKHMIFMAKEAIESGVILGFIIPLKIKKLFNSLEKLKEKEKKEFLVLGGGDIVFPLIVCLSLVQEKGPYFHLLAVFSLFGLWMNFFVFQKKKKPLPALPLITIFSLIGYFLIKSFLLE